MVAPRRIHVSSAVGMQPPGTRSTGKTVLVIGNHVWTTQWEYITAAKAEEYLEHIIEGNRDYKRLLAEGYRDSMVDGTWDITAQGISLAEPIQDAPAIEKLLDARHRLNGVRMAGPILDALDPDGAPHGFWFLVTRGIEKKAFKHYDIGQKRGPTDALQVEHFTEHVARSKAVPWLWRYDDGRMAGTNLASMATRDELIYVAQVYPTILSQWERLRKEAKLWNTGLACALWTILHETDKPDLADKFCEKLFFKNGLDREDTGIKDILKELETRHENKEKGEPVLLARKVSRLWNYVYNGRPQPVNINRLRSLVVGHSLLGLDDGPFPPFAGRSPRKINVFDVSRINVVLLEKIQKDTEVIENIKAAQLALGLEPAVAPNPEPESSFDGDYYYEG